MENIQNKELLVLIDKAVAGDKDSLETVILSVQDLVFNPVSYTHLTLPTTPYV